MELWNAPIYLFVCIYLPPDSNQRQWYADYTSSLPYFNFICIFAVYSMYGMTISNLAPPKRKSNNLVAIGNRTEHKCCQYTVTAHIGLESFDVICWQFRLRMRPMLCDVTFYFGLRFNSFSVY